MVGVVAAARRPGRSQRPGVVARASAALRESPRRRMAVIALAALFGLLWLLSAFNTDGRRAREPSVGDNIAFWTDEAFSLLGGHAPLVDFHAQYGHLWAYVAAGGLTLFGATLAVYAPSCSPEPRARSPRCSRPSAAWRAAGPLALVLFVPFTATSFYMEVGPLGNRYGPANLFSLSRSATAAPTCCCGSSCAGCSAARRERRRAVRRWRASSRSTTSSSGCRRSGRHLLALAAAEDRSPRRCARLGAAALAGVAIALALVSRADARVAGSLPHLGMLLDFPRIYGTEGFGLLPMPSIGFHLVVYVTFAAAIVVAVVRSRAGAARGRR